MFAEKARSAVAAVLAALVLASLTGCNPAEPSDDPSVADPATSSDAQTAQAGYQLVTPDTLTVCADVPYPPFLVESPASPSRYSGFDVDLVQAIADGLRLRLSFFLVDFKSMQSGVPQAAGKCDFGASAMTITDERKANLDFSDPYFESSQSLMAPADSGVVSLAELVGKRIGVESGTTSKAFAQIHAPKNAKLVDYSSDPEMWEALQRGDVDAIIEDFPATKTHEKANPDFKVVATYQTDEQYGYAFAKGEKATLLAAVNDQLAKLRADGTYYKIYGKYFG